MKKGKLHIRGGLSQRQSLTRGIIGPVKGSLLAAIFALSLFGLFMQPTDAVTTVPTKMNFQGRLTDNAGVPMADGLYNMKFRLFTVSTGGSNVWTETRETTNRVQVTNGLFSVQLGDVTPIPATLFASGNLYFEIELPTPATATCSTASCGNFSEGPMSPRHPLASSAYAMNSETVDGLDSTQLSRTDASNTFSGNTQTFQNGSNSVNAFQIQNASGSKLLGVDTLNSQVTVRGYDENFIRGPELITITDFTNAAWTSSGWTKTAATATNTTNNFATLSTNQVILTPGDFYEVSYTVSGGGEPVTDCLEAALGGALANRYTVFCDGSGTTSATETVIIAAGNSNSLLEFKPWDGNEWAISNVSVKHLTPTAATPAFALQDASGQAALEMRIGNALDRNTFIGLASGKHNIDGMWNVAVGAKSLEMNESGSANVAIGEEALQSNTTGNSNVAIGLDALKANVNGDGNVAVGTSALAKNLAGIYNTAIGGAALNSNTTGTYNLASGFMSLSQNTTGSENVASGLYAGYRNTTGSNNTALGSNAGYQDYLGFQTGSNLQRSTAIGAYAQVQASDSIVLGSVDYSTKVGIGITVPSNMLSVSGLHYQTGSVTRTNGSSTLTGTGTTWTSAMVGDLIVFADGTTNKVASVSNATTAIMTTTYTGTTDGTPIKYRFHYPGFQVASTGDVAVQNTSTQAFQVQNASGVATLTADTANSRIIVGSTATDSTAVLLALDSYDQGTDPAGVNGAMYYNTNLNKFRCYQNGAWADCIGTGSRSTTKIVGTSAAGGTSGAVASLTTMGADYVNTSTTSAQTTINSAITALGSAGGTVYLMEGTYIIDTTINLSAKVKLTGSGPGTVIKLKNGINATVDAITTGSASEVSIENLSLEGNKTNNTGTQRGINVGNSGSATLSGVTISNITISNFRDYGVYMVSGKSHKIVNSSFFSNTMGGIYANASTEVTISNNIVSSNGSYGIFLALSNSTISNNTLRSNGIGIYVQGGASNTISGNTIAASTGTYSLDIWSGGANNVVTGNIVSGGAGSGISVRQSSSQTTVTANIIESNATTGLLVHSSASAVVTNNKLYNNGGTGANHGISIISTASSPVVTGNTIVDTAGTGNAINIDSSITDAYIADNVYSGTGATSINDASTTTKYANQMNSSGQLINSASGGLATRLVSGSSNDLFQAQNSSGVAIMKVTSTGALQAASFDTTAAGALAIGVTNATSITLSQNTTVASGKTFTTEGATTVKVTSATAFQVQNAGGTALFAVDTSGSTVTVGSSTNGIVMSANGLVFSGTARPTRTITFTPEYSGATFTGDGTSNTGTLTSDFCSGSSRQNINASACGATDTRNYYQWANTQATAQDYDIYIRYQIPSDYSSGSMTNLTLFGWGTTTATESATVQLYSDASGTACSTSGNAVTSNAAWTSATVASPLGACTVSAGDTVTFKVRLVAGQNNSVRASAISFGYRQAF